MQIESTSTRVTLSVQAKLHDLTPEDDITDSHSSIGRKFSPQGVVFNVVDGKPESVRVLGPIRLKSGELSTNTRADRTYYSFRDEAERPAWLRCLVQHYVEEAEAGNLNGAAVTKLRTSDLKVSLTEG